MEPIDERDIEKKVADLCSSIIGRKPVRGMTMIQAFSVIIEALEAGLEYKLGLKKDGVIRGELQGR